MVMESPFGYSDFPFLGGWCYCLGGLLVVFRGVVMVSGLRFLRFWFVVLQVFPRGSAGFSFPAPLLCSGLRLAVQGQVLCSWCLGGPSFSPKRLDCNQIWFV